MILGRFWLLRRLVLLRFVALLVVGLGKGGLFRCATQELGVWILSAFGIRASSSGSMEWVCCLQEALGGGDI